LTAMVSLRLLEGDAEHDQAAVLLGNGDTRVSKQVGECAADLSFRVLFWPRDTPCPVLLPDGGELDPIAIRVQALNGKPGREIPRR